MTMIQVINEDKLQLCLSNLKVADAEEDFTQ